jgi:hypothetical protein
MKRTILIVSLGLLGACLAHLAWFQLRRPASFNPADGDLAWMKTELKLSNEQFAKIQGIHNECNPRILALAAQVSRMRGELMAFEEERRTQGQIDFLEFARFVENRRTVDKACLDSTRRLVMATAEVMTPQQRERYLGIVNPMINQELTRKF